jgi:hypothetical protein
VDHLRKVTGSIATCAASSSSSSSRQREFHSKYR